MKRLVSLILVFAMLVPMLPMGVLAEETEATAPVEGQPVETAPAETAPPKPEPTVTEPVETEPPVTEPAETVPQETEPIPTEAEPTESVETVPLETEPIPTEAEPTESDESSETLESMKSTANSCGEDLTWELDEEGTLTISGTGEMEDYFDRKWGEPEEDDPGYAPWHGQNITAITVEEGVTSIGSGAFRDCGQLERITLSDTVTAIGNAAFCDCQLPAELALPKHLERIGNDAFCRCSGLKSLTIPNSVTSIGSSAFWNCYMMEELILPDGLTTLQTETLAYCTSLKRITIPASVTEIEEYAFNGNKRLNLIYYSGTAEQWEQIIGELAEGNEPLQKATVIYDADSSVHETSLSWNIDSEGLLTISGSGLMPDYDWEDSAPWASRAAEIKNVVIEDGLLSIGDMAFHQNSKMQSIRIPASVKIIGRNPFGYCMALTDIIIDENNPAFCVEDGAILTKDRKELVSVPIVQTAGAYRIPEGVESVREKAFFCNVKLRKVYIPASAVDLAYNALENCPALTEITVAKENPAVTSQDGVLFTKDMTALLLYPGSKADADYAVPQGVAHILPNAFVNTNNLTSVSIPSGVSTIGAYSFFGCPNLTTVSLPTSIRNIGEQAFDESGLTDVYFDGTEKLWRSIEIVDQNEWLLERATIHFGNNTSILSGSCGENLTFELDDNGLLTISGTGAMTDYEYSEAPWFGFAQMLDRVVVAEGVTSIGSFAFCETNLTGASLPASITRIGDNAFCACSNLASITLPENLTGIGDWAFYGCQNLKSLTIPESVTEISNYAFHECTGLTDITLSEGIATIGYMAFAGCVSLESLTIPDSVTEIGGWAFDRCSNITDITVGKNLGGIGCCVFRDCSSIETVLIPEGVKFIDSGAFSNCTALKQITIPGSVEWIGDGAFADCTALQDVYYGGLSIRLKYSVDQGNECLLNANIHYSDSVESGSWGDGIQWELSGDGTMTVTGNGSLTDFPEPDITWCVERVVLDDGITGIGGWVFAYWQNLASIEIPESVTEIGEYAFGYCPALTEVIIPKNVTVIRNYTFTECSALQRVVIPAGVTEIQECAFSNCTGLTEVVLPNGLTSIAALTFNNCSSLRSIGIPYGVTEIGIGAFAGCSSLESVEIPETVAYIGSVAFSSCTALTDLVIPDSVTVLDSCAFSDCTGLRTVRIPANITAIRYGAFSGCTALQDVYFDGMRLQLAALTASENAPLLNAELHCSESEINGTCGDNLQWNLNNSGVLTITGSGAMDDFEMAGAPWNQYANAIDTIVLSEGVTRIGNNAFNHTSPAYLTIPAGVAAIGDYAFYECKNVVSVSVLGSLTSIGEWAFYGCDKLQNITLPVSVSEIDAYAFRACSSLTGFTLPGGVTAIADGLFLECSNLKSVTIPEGVTEIGSWAFYDCSNLENVTIPESIISMHNAAFSGCSALKRITVPAGIQYLESFMFNECSALAEVTLSEGITQIGNGAFSGCTGLGSLTIPETVTYISGDVFKGCTGLQSITLPRSVEWIYLDAFEGCSALQDVYYGGTRRQLESIVDSVTDMFPNAQIHYPEVVCSGSCGETAQWSLNAEGVLTISGSGTVTSAPDSTVMRWVERAEILEGITAIGKDVFFNCSNLTSVVIPNTVTEIQDNAFRYCGGLTEVTIPNSVTAIGNWAFYECTGLKTLTLPNSLTALGFQAFYGCSGLESVTLPGSLTIIPNSAFAYCTGLRNVVIPEGVTKIESTAFDDCTALERVTLPESLTCLGSFAFCNCIALESIDIPSGVTEILIGTFEGCESLTSVILANTERIEDRAFNGCRSLESITIPGKTNYIGSNAFAGCTALKDVYYDGISQHLTAVAQEGNQPLLDAAIHYPEVIFSGSCGDNLFWSISGTGTLTISGTGDMENGAPWYDHRLSVSSVVIGEGVTSIAPSAFQYCTGLTSVTISDSVTGIGSIAFLRCTGLKRIHIPAGVTELGFGFVQGCDQLEEITVAEDNSAFVIRDGVLFNKEETTLLLYPCARTDDTYVIPQGVQRIESMAFREAVHLTDVTIPEGVTNIGNYAFEGCTSLRSVTIPGSITSIGNNAFSDCEALEDVYYRGLQQLLPTLVYYGNAPLLNAEIHCPEVVADGTCGADLRWSLSGTGILTISGTGVMANYSDSSDAPWVNYRVYIESVVIRDGVTSIGDNAFYCHYSLKSVAIPDSVTTIGSSAFGNCSGLASVTISESVTKIGTSAFYGCANLTEISIPDGVTRIEPGTFNGCSSLTRVTIPASVSVIGNTAFAWCGNLAEITIPQGVTEIGTAAFNGCGSLTEITIPAGVTAIEESTFSSCDNLTAITLPNNVTQIGRYAFSGCSSLTNLTMPVSASINRYAFDGCNSITKVRLTPGTGVGTAYTSGNYSYTPWYANRSHSIEVILEEGIRSIGSLTFNGCSGLQRVTIPGSVTTIGNSAFGNCDCLSEVTISDGVSTIGDYAFCGCTALCEITLPDSITDIGTYAFDGCSVMILSGIPGSVTRIGSGAFRDCASLREVSIPAGITEIPGAAFSGCTCLAVVTLPEGLQRIGEDAFVNCPAMTEITVPKSIQSIGNHALGYDNEEPVEGFTITGYGGTDAERYARANGFTFNDLSSIELGVEKITTQIDGGKVSPASSRISADAVRIAGNTYEAGIPGEFVIRASDGNIVYTSQVTPPGVFGDAQTYTMDWDFDAAPAGTYTVTFRLMLNGEAAAEKSTEVTVSQKVPEQIINVSATGGIQSIYLSWSISSELDTQTYRVYRKEADAETFTLLAQFRNRNTLSYEDKTAEKGKTYTYYVTGVNSFLMESEPSELASAARVVDTTAPVVTKLTPANASYLKGSVTVTMTAQDNTAVVRSMLQYSSDGGETWETFAEKSSGILDTTVLSDGQLYIRGIAFDEEGNESSPLTYVYMVDNTGPAQVQNLAWEATTVSLTLRWDNVPDDDIQYFRVERLQQDGTYVRVQDVSSTLGVNLFNLTPDTEYTYRVAGYDLRGNRGEASEPVTARTLPDTTAPVITEIRPLSGHFRESIPVSITAKDDYGIASLRVQYSVDNETWQDADVRSYATAAASRSVSYTLSLEALEEGSVYIRGIASDFAGNESVSDETAPFVQHLIDRTAPAAPQQVQANGYFGYIEVTWARNSETDLSGYSVYRSSSEAGPYTRIDGGWLRDRYIDRNVTPDETYYYKIAVADTAGNVSDYSEAVSATAGTDSEKPVIVSIYPASGSKLGAGYRTVSVLASDNGLLDTVCISIQTKSGEYAELVSAKNIEKSSHTQTALISMVGREDGDPIRIQVYAVDANGNTSEIAEASYIADITAPTVTGVAAEFREDAVQITWNSGMEEDLAGYYVYRAEGTSEEFRAIGQRTVAAGQFSYAFTDYNIAYGEVTYTYRIEAIDRWGNRSAMTSEPVVTPPKSEESKNIVPTAVIACESTMEIGVEYLFDGSRSYGEAAIAKYTWDFGDGQTSQAAAPIHVYRALGNYTATLTVEDSEGRTGSASWSIVVKSRSTVGTVRIKVVDENGKTVSEAPVYFDLGDANQFIRATDHSGFAEFTAEPGRHSVGCIIADNEWLPTKSSVIARAGETVDLTLTMVHHTLIEGQFEVKRMTFEEIVAAGIDVSKPENQHYVQFDIKLTYDNVEVKTSFHYNPSTGDNDIKPIIIKKDDGDHKITPIPIPPIVGGSGGGGGGIGGGELHKTEVPTAIAILDIPAQASMLKEFFDVKLTIINNAASEFSMRDNVVSLHVPEGLTLVKTDVSESSPLVTIPEIRGQASETIAWILRGDKEGEYDLTADYSGILSQFNAPISTVFKTGEPICVYGLGAMKLIIEANKTARYGAYYFNIGLKNNSPVPMYLPKIGVVNDIISTYLEACGKDPENQKVVVRLLNTCLRDAAGADTPYGAGAEITVLEPGEMLLKKYAAYNAVDYFHTMWLKDAAVEFVGEYSVDYEIIPLDMNLYDCSSALEKVAEIKNNGQKRAAYERIMDDSSYAYVWASLEHDTDMGKLIADELYYAMHILDLQLPATKKKEDKQKMVRSILAEMMQDEATQMDVDFRIDDTYLEFAKTYLNAMAGQIPGDTEFDSEMFAAITDIAQDSVAMEEFKQVLRKEGPNGVKDNMLTALEPVLSAAAWEYLAMQLDDTLLGSAYFEALDTTCKAFEVPLYVFDTLAGAWNDAAEMTEQIIAIGAAKEEGTALIKMLLEYSKDEVIREELQYILDNLESSYHVQWSNLERELIQAAAEGAGKLIAIEILKNYFGKSMLKTLEILNLAFKGIDYAFDWSGSVQDALAMRMNYEFTKYMVDAGRKYQLEPSSEAEALYTLRALKNLTKMRLLGETRYLEIKNAGSFEERQAAVADVNKLNGGGLYTSLDEYYAKSIRTILTCRDTIFGGDSVAPGPKVTFNLNAYTTNEVFSPEYEYSIGGNEWITCEDDVIRPELSEKTRVLYVRGKAGNGFAATETTTVDIPGVREPKDNYSGDFFYTSGYIDEVTSVPYTYDYNDNWFAEESTGYNHSMAQFGIRLAMAGFGAGEDSNSTNITKFMRDLDYDTIESHYDFPEVDSIGYIIGSKRVRFDDGIKTIILVVVRGAGYRYEWASNFKVGTGAEHQGFSEAAQVVYDGLLMYLKKNNITPDDTVKLMVTGYSRAAATTNLVTAKVDDAIAGKKLGFKKENVYAYCYECPQTTRSASVHSDQYSNIHCIVNDVDPVPKVAMSFWGYDRYGNTYHLPSAEYFGKNYKTIAAKMKSTYKNILTIGKVPYKESKFKDNTSPVEAQGTLLDILLAKLTFYISKPGIPNTYDYVYRGFQLEMQGIGKSLGESAKAEKDLGVAVGYLWQGALGLPLLVPFLAEAPVETGIIIGNKDQIGGAHVPELCLAWMDTIPGTMVKKDVMSYRMSVNCPVDVEVYDSDGTLVAKIVNDEVIDVGSYLESFIDSNGQKIIILPGNEVFDIRYLATDDGTMSCHVEQHNGTGIPTAVTNYYDIPITKDDVLSGSVTPAQGVTIIDEEQNVIPPDQIMAGGQVNQYNVEATSEGKGSITGGGTFTEGSFAKLTAAPEAGWIFDGWYENGECISNEDSFRFAVTENRNVTAVFTEREDYDLSDTPVVIEQEYLVLSVEQTEQLQLTLEDEALRSKLVWTAENAEEGEPVISVAEDGTVTALRSGTAYAIAAVTVNDSTYSDRCRIDVVAVDDPEEEHPIAVKVNAIHTPYTAFTVELFKTDYTQMTVLLELEQNSLQKTNALSGMTGNNGSAIESARFAEAAAAEKFSIRVVDDRHLAIVPTEASLNNPKAVPGKLISAVILTVDGQDYTTKAMTLTVKKTLPKLKAVPVKVNSYTKAPVNLQFTGGTAADIQLQKDLPTGFALDGMTLRYTGALAKTSASIPLLVTLKEWAGTYPVTVSVAVARTEPAVKLGTGSVTILPGTVDRVSVPVTITGVPYDPDDLVLELKDSLNAASDALEYSIANGVITVSAKKDTPYGKTYKLYVSAVDATKKTVLTIKTLAVNAKLTLKAPASGAIDLAVPNSPITLTAAISGFHAGSGEEYKVEVIQSGTDADVTNLFSFHAEKNVLTLTAAGDIPKGYTYTANVYADLNKDSVPECTAAVKLPVKWSDPAKVPASVTLRAEGTLDVIRPGTSIRITPTFKNLFGYELKETDLTFFGNAVKLEPSEVPFDVRVENGAYRITNRNADSSVKYTVQFTGKSITNKPIALRVTMGAVKLTQSAKTVDLFTVDKYSGANVFLTLNDNTLAPIARIVQDEASKAYYKVTYLGNGRVYIQFAASGWKKMPVKLNIYMVGNQTAKSNAVATVTVVPK